jgi:hypothetical protein
VAHLGLDTDPPPLTPARSPPQLDLALDPDPGFTFNQDPGPASPAAWADLDQTAGQTNWD